MTNLVKQDPGPVRTCVGCGERGGRRELVRVVTTPESALAVDSKKSLPGRGTWLHPSKECYARARKTGRLKRSLRYNGENWGQLEDFFAACD